MRLLLIATLLALSTPRQSGAPQTFRSGAQIIEVDVRVLKDGKFVTDLGPADFEITEDGVPQKITSVVLINGTAPSAPSAPAPSAPSAPAPSAPSAPLVPPAPASHPSVWVFVFDTPHLTPGPLQRGRDAIATFVKDKLPAGSIGGVVAEGKLANNRFSSDREELLKAVRSIKAGGDTRAHLLLQREWPRIQDEEEAIRLDRRDAETLKVAVDRACTEDPDFCQRPHGRDAVQSLLEDKARDAVVQGRTRSMLTLNTIEALGRGLARIPGPKTVIFLSEGFVVSNMEGELRQAVARAGVAGAHVYSIDARGLDRSGGAIIDQVVAFDRAGGQMGFDLQADGSNSLAVDTGGFAIRNENNFGRALDEILKDAGTYYVVGYAPANSNFDGKYRSIAVTVSRPDVKVRARRGYLALEPAALLRPAARPVTATAPPELASEDSRTKAGSVAPPTALPGERLAPTASELSVPRGVSKATADEVSPKLPAEDSRAKAGAIVTALGRESAAARMRPGAGEASPVAGSAADRGWAAYERGDVESAARELGEAAKAPDARPWISYALGLSQFALRRYRDATQAWERVRREVPEFEPTYFSLADAYTLQKEDGAALKVLREAERRWPADPEVANAVGVIHVRRGALDAAIESFERATTVAPSDALGFFNLARTHQMRLLKSQRYDPQTQKWIGGDDDRRRAVANFRKYLEIGGPYERQAKEALAALAWK